MIATIGTFLVANLGIPERFKKIAAWVAIAIGAAILLTGAKLAYDASVIDDYEQDRSIRSIDARDRSAEDRAQDAINNVLAEMDRERAIAQAQASEAVKEADQRAGLSPQELALNCARLRQAGLTGEPSYKELCS